MSDFPRCYCLRCINKYLVRGKAVRGQALREKELRAKAEREKELQMERTQRQVFLKNRSFPALMQVSRESRCKCGAEYPGAIKRAVPGSEIPQKNQSFSN